MRIPVIAVMLAALATPASADGNAIQPELGALLDRVALALNGDDIDTLLDVATPDIAFSAMNGRVAHGSAGVRSYFDAMRGAARGVEEYHIALLPDGPAALHGGDTAIAVGRAEAHYKFKGGMVLDAHGRWTAILTRMPEGWRIAAVHYSSNIFDNPVLNAAKSAAPIAGGVAGASGLLAGFFLGRWRRRRMAA